MCDLDTFLRFVCEHDGSPAAQQHRERVERERLAQHSPSGRPQQQQRSTGARGKGGGSPGSSHGSPTPGRGSKSRRAWSRSPSTGGSTPIEWAEFVDLLIGKSGDEQARDAEGSEALPVEAAKALFLKCGAADGRIDRRSFVQAAAADEQRRARARARPLEA